VPCKVRNDLMDRLEKSIRAYSEAVEAMKGQRGNEFAQAQTEANRARGFCDGCRADLAAHDMAHGCVDTVL